MQSLWQLTALLFGIFSYTLQIDCVKHDRLIAFPPTSKLHHTHFSYLCSNTSVYFPSLSQFINRIRTDESSYHQTANKIYNNAKNVLQEILARYDLHLCVHLRISCKACLKIAYKCIKCFVYYHIEFIVFQPYSIQIQIMILFLIPCFHRVNSWMVVFLHDDVKQFYTHNSYTLFQTKPNCLIECPVS